jgi:hypothetical protein
VTPAGVTSARSRPKVFCGFFCNSQAGQKKKPSLKAIKKERTSFCEQKEAKKL